MTNLHALYDNISLNFPELIHPEEASTFYPRGHLSQKNQYARYVIFLSGLGKNMCFRENTMFKQLMSSLFLLILVIALDR